VNGRSFWVIVLKNRLDVDVAGTDPQTKIVVVRPVVPLRTAFGLLIDDAASANVVVHALCHVFEGQSFQVVCDPVEYKVFGGDITSYVPLCQDGPELCQGIGVCKWGHPSPILTTRIVLFCILRFIILKVKETQRNRRRLIGMRRGQQHRYRTFVHYTTSAAR